MKYKLEIDTTGMPDKEIIRQLRILHTAMIGEIIEDIKVKRKQTFK